MQALANRKGDEAVNVHKARFYTWFVLERRLTVQAHTTEAEANDTAQRKGRVRVQEGVDWQRRDPRSTSAISPKELYGPATAVCV